MSLKYLTPAALANEWLTDNEYNGKIKEELLFRWASRASGLITGVECYSFQVALIDVRNYVGHVPPYLKSIYLAGCVADFNMKWSREEMRSWTYDAFGTDCEIEVNVKCPNCKNLSCDCSAPVIELDMDQLYREQRPYLTHVNYDHFVGYSAAQTDGVARMGMNEKFTLMFPQVSDSAWWNTEYYLGVCASLGPNRSGYYSFKIDEDKFITDLQEGQVLISYLGERRTPDGYRLIPNVEIVVEAVGAYIDLKVLSKLYNFGGNQTDRLRVYDAERKWKELRAEAKTKLRMPSSAEWEALTKKHWHIRPDRYHYGR